MNPLTQKILIEFVLDLKKNRFKDIIKDLKIDLSSNEDGSEYIYLGLIILRKKERNKGHGSLIMKEIISLANEYELPIKLYSTAAYGSKIDKLNEFYN